MREKKTEERRTEERSRREEENTGVMRRGTR